jgi:ribosomal protein L11 methyltransferase
MNPTPRSYVEVEIQADASLTEQLIGLMSQLGFEGFWEDQMSLKCYMGSQRWEPGMLAEVESLAGLLVQTSKSSLPRISVRTIREENWNAAWEKTIQPIRISPRIVVAPSWQPFTPQAGEVVLTINPKMSFGTGYHESTRLAAGLLESSLRPGMTVLDIGTGTGILAIASVKLGAREATGIDTDEWAYNNACENADLNDVRHLVHLRLCSVKELDRKRFHIVLANIQKDVIQRLLHDMVDRLEPSGTLILSGLLEADDKPIEEQLLSEGMCIMQKVREDDWIALAAQPKTEYHARDPHLT